MFTTEGKDTLAIYAVRSFCSFHLDEKGLSLLPAQNKKGQLKKIWFSDVMYSDTVPENHWKLIN